MDLDKESVRKAALGFAGVTETVIYTIAGYFAGHYLDALLKNKNPWLAGLLTLVGFIGGFYRLFKLLIQSDRNGNGKDTG